MASSQQANASLEAADSLETSRRSAVSDAFKKAHVSLDKIVQEEALIGFADMKAFMSIDDEGNIAARPLDRLKPKKISKVIKKIRISTRTNTSKDGDTYTDTHVDFELYDKQEALKTLIKLGDYNPSEKHELAGKDGGPIETVAYTDLERANRLNFLVQEAVKRKREAGQ